MRLILIAFLSLGCAAGADDETDLAHDAGRARDADAGGPLFEAEPVDDSAPIDSIDTAPTDAPSADTPYDAGCGALTLCDSFCVDTAVHPSHCGTCGHKCAAGEVCVSGACTLVCPPSKTKCGSVCVDAATDVANCGACAKACPTGANGSPFCSGGACGFACAAGFGHCSGGAIGCETNLTTNPAHCGTCANACPKDYSCVAGTCVPPPSCAVTGCAGGYCCEGTGKCCPTGNYSCCPTACFYKGCAAGVTCCEKPSAFGKCVAPGACI